MLVDNREMTDLLLGLRSASYSLDMHHEDNPHVSKERLLYVIKGNTHSELRERIFCEAKSYQSSLSHPHTIWNDGTGVK